VSLFGPRLAGAGGFINITQNARNVVFAGTFTAGGLEVEVVDGNLRILQEGKSRKLVKRVEQITFNGSYAAETGQSVLYVTERCVFRRTAEGLILSEVAPGIDIARDILAHMDFEPVIDAPATMDPGMFPQDLMPPPAIFFALGRPGYPGSGAPAPATPEGGCARPTPAARGRGPGPGLCDSPFAGGGWGRAPVQDCPQPAPSVAARPGRATPAAARTPPDHAGGQYVARPPEMSNTAPVVNEHSSDESHATSAATSSTVPGRPSGIFESM